jgi:hypothetical protein
MLTKADFQRAIADSIGQYPELTSRYHARDPIILQHLEAIATMLAMLAQGLDVAQSEVFLKARDATVLADAAMRGIVPKAKPARVTLIATNKSATAAPLDAGRQLRDARGRPWVITAGATVPAGGNASIQAEQRTRDTITHSVARDEPFYAIQIPSARSDGQRLSALEVRDSANTEWAYAQHYTNIPSGAKAYHVEVDERQRAYVRFGLADSVGVQPAIGDQFTLTLDYSFGNVSAELGSGFSLASVHAPQDAFVTLAMVAVIEQGQDPVSVDTLRMLARYPSVYNPNAVYLGEFDFLIRRHFHSLRFLSVWNERIEERQRGMSVNNINTLFVACLGDEGAEPTLTRSETLTEGVEIAPASWTPLQHEIAETIQRADNSYRVRFFTPLREPRHWRIEALVGTAYVPSAIAQRIRERILARYGEAARTRGGEAVAVQDIYADLRAHIPEIAEPGADVTVWLPEPDASDPPPETWRYVTDATLSVGVSAVSVTPPSWGW